MRSEAGRTLLSIGIIADDLTGAADSIAPFAQRGLLAHVGFLAEEVAACRVRPTDAFALNTETRALPATHSLRITARVQDAVRNLLQETEPKLLYKKIDSTLRGHLKAELDAMLQEVPERLPILCPAYPANGRAFLRGQLHLHGKPQAETLQACFGLEQGTPSLSLETLRQGVEGVAKILQRHYATHQPLCVDAVTEGDLEILAQAILLSPQNYLPVGSAGLCAALATVCNWQSGQSRPSAWPAGAITDGRVLVVVGSRNPVSRRQAAFLAERAGCLPIVVGSSEESALVAQPLASPQRITLLITPDAETDNPAVATVASRLMQKEKRSQHPFEGLLLTGGATAMTLLQHLGSTGLEIMGELQPGIIRARMQVSSPESLSANGLHGLPIITKAGGFGDERTLARCVGVD